MRTELLPPSSLGSQLISLLMGNWKGPGSPLLPMWEPLREGGPCHSECHNNPFAGQRELKYTLLYPTTGPSLARTYIPRKLGSSCLDQQEKTRLALKVGQAVPRLQPQLL